MIVRIARNTGFFGMGSPLQILLNGEVIAHIDEKQVKEISIRNAESFTLQIRLFLMKSQVYAFESKNEHLALQIIMNPKLVSMYLALFIVIAFLPMMLRTPAVSVLLIGLYGVFIAGRLNRFYLIVEDADDA